MSKTPVKTVPFGRYVLLRRIAVGGMAEIYRAIAYGSEGFRKPVAIKRLLPFLSENAEYVEMFIREARLAAMLNHANIVQLYDFGRIEGLLYISMEYVHGKDLAELIDRVREESYTVPAELACHLLIQVLEGLRYAHTTHSDTSGKAGLIHRDVTPPNIMISFSGEVKIADFGIAKFPREKTSEGTTLKGKLSYMSPEQASGLSLDHRSDLFSLAICICELLTLRHVFDGKNDFDVLNKIREVEFTPPRVLNPSIPEPLEAILLKALEGDPDQRYQNASEFYSAVESFMIEMNYRYSATWLANYMRDLFKEDLAVELEELRAEGELAETLRPEEPGGEPEEKEPPVHPRSLDIEPYEDMPTETGAMREIRGATYADLVKSLDKSEVYEEETEHEAATIPVMYEKAMRPGEKTFGDVTAVKKKEEMPDPADAGDEIKTVPLSARPDLALDVEPPEAPQNEEILTMPLGKKPKVPERPTVQVSEFDETQLAQREPRGFFRRHWFAFVFVILGAALAGLLYHLHRQKQSSATVAHGPDGEPVRDAGVVQAAAEPPLLSGEPDAGVVEDAGVLAGLDGDSEDAGGELSPDAGDPADQKKPQVRKRRRKRTLRRRRKRRRRKKTRTKRRRKKKRTKTRRSKKPGK